MPVRLVSHEEPLKGYRLIERLGRGGFGEVWKVEAPGGLLKAMKFVFGDLDAADEESRPAEQELKALKRVQSIRHPYVLSLERYDIIEGQLMIVMELADENLWDRFRKFRGQGLPGIPRDELLRYMEETAEALDLMNNHYQIQHLDVKPQNLFVVFNHVKVGDFGLAKLLEGVRATVTGGVTPVYAAPETFEGYVSRFSDQYSLAIVFQELLTGARPFNGSNTRQLLMQHISGAPDLNALPQADKPIIARSLAKKPDDRWPTCTEMVRALKLASLSGDSTPPPGTRTPTGRGSDAFDNSVMATRLQFGGSGRLGPDPTANGTKVQTPRPGAAASGRHPRPPAAPVSVGPMPALVTVGPAGQVVPRLVTPAPSHSGSNPAVTLPRMPVVQTGRMNSHGIAPPERNGDGSLFPALIIGVGNLGRLVLGDLGRIIRDRYGDLANLPNLRFLSIDTDPEGANPQDSNGGRDLVLARLNRPTHYLQRDTLPAVEQWLPPGALYKIARNPGAADGIRAFGRLALLDHYRVVVQRIRQEIEGFLDEASLAKADETTKLGLRTNRPRAYLIAGLGGGTGGGMFLDLAFLLRHEFRSVGFFRPEVAGVFLVPPADKQTARSASLANAHAALGELLHFQSKATKYQTTFDKSEPPVVDAEAPFARVAVLPLPKAVDPTGRAAVTGRAARALFNEMLTPTGRVIDEVRDVYRNAFASAVPTCQSFGLYRLTWPRPEVLGASTRRFAQRLLNRWMAKDAAALRDPIKTWLDGQWNERRLDFEQVVESFEAAAKGALRESPDKVFDAFIDPLRTRTPSGSKLDAAAVCTVLDQLIKVVGKPGDDGEGSDGVLPAALIARFRGFTKDAEGQLALMAVTFIEQAQYRLAGAEEAVRQIGDRLKRQVEALEPVHVDLGRELKGTYARVLQMIGSLSTGSWKSSATNEGLDLLRTFARGRLRFLILDLCLSAYRKLLGASPEYLREIGTCRAGLVEINAAVEAAPKSSNVGPGKLILPDGCNSLDDAADRFLAGLNPEDILNFDQALQRETAKKFRGLAAVALKPAEKGPPFRELLLMRVRDFLDQKLDTADPATVFFRNRTGGPTDYPLIEEAFKGARPDATASLADKPDEVTILAVPPGNVGDRFRSVVGLALPDVEFMPAPLPNDIVFYREQPQVPLTDLPQLGEYGRAAAQAVATGDHPLPSRIDVAWTPPNG